MLLARRKELDKNGYNNHLDYMQALKQRPEKLQLRIRHLQEPGPNWDEKLYGPFPAKGLLLVYTRYDWKQLCVHVQIYLN